MGEGPNTEVSPGLKTQSWRHSLLKHRPCMGCFSLIAASRHVFACRGSLWPCLSLQAGETRA